MKLYYKDKKSSSLDQVSVNPISFGE